MPAYNLRTRKNCVSGVEVVVTWNVPSGSCVMAAVLSSAYAPVTSVDFYNLKLLTVSVPSELLNLMVTFDPLRLMFVTSGGVIRPTLRLAWQTAPADSPTESKGSE